MTHGKKRFLALLLALTMCLSLLPATAFAEGEDEETGTIALVEDPAGDPPLDVPPEDPEEELPRPEDGGAIAPAAEIEQEQPAEPEALPPAEEIEGVTANGECGDDLTWSFDEETGTLTVTGEGEMWDAPMAWDDIKDQIRAVVIEEGATCVGGSAFSDCGALTSVTLPTSLRWVGNSSFYNCDALTGIVIPEGVRELYSSAFNDCDALIGVTLPESLTSIYYSAFNDCDSLATITIPLGVTYIENYAFGYCSSLSEITFQGAAPSMDYYVFYEVGATAYYPSNIPGWTEDVLQNYGGTLNWVPYEVEDSVVAEGVCGNDLTWTLSSLGVLTISGSGDMYDWSYSGEVPWNGYVGMISSLVLPDGLTRIGSCAFYSCRNLTQAELPDTVTSIGSSAFGYCGLTRISMPASLVSISYDAFYGNNGLTDVYYGGTMEAWGQIDLYDGNRPLLTATIHCTDGDIDNSARCGNNLTWSFDEETGTLTVTGEGQMWDAPMAWDGIKDQIRAVVIEEGATCVGDSAFSDCGALTSVTLPTSLRRVGNSSFYNCDALTGIVIPEGVRELDSDAFNNCDVLADVTLPESLAYIYYSAFGYCNSLATITIPLGVTYIENYAFYCCGSLSEITFQGAAPQIDETAFVEVNATAYYPSNIPGWTEDVLQNYGGTLNWVPYEVEDSVVAEGVCGDDLTWTLSSLGVLTISGSGEMYDFDYDGLPWGAWRGIVSTVKLPDGLTGIGEYAFNNCTNLTGVTIPYGVTSIRYSSFAKCRSLTSIEIPEGVTDIGSSAFSYCERLASVTLPESLTFLGGYAFYECEALTEIVIPDNVEGVHYETFYGCDSLVSVTLPKNGTAIDSYAFYGCGSLADITIPCNVGWISYYAFYCCGSLSKITFEGFAPQIDETAFVEVNATAYYPSNIPGWTEDVLQNYGGTLEWVPYEAEETVIASGVCGDDLTWTLTNTGEMVISGTGDMYDWNSSGQGPWWEYRNSVFSLEAEDGVTSIGGAAFSNCNRLTVVTLPESLTVIGGEAFSGCTALEYIRIPAGVTSIGSYAFNYCDRLTAIDVAEENAAYSSLDGILYNKDRTILIRCPGGKTGAVAVPEGVTGFESYAFSYCFGLTNVTLPESVRELSFCLFENCEELTEMTIPEGVTTLSAYTFSFCKGLVSVTLPESLTRIEYEAFRNCEALTEITIPNRVVQIDSYAFGYCSSLGTITFQGGVPEFGWEVFRDVTATAWYPSNNLSWTEDALQNYGGTITWEPYEVEDSVIAEGVCGDDLAWTLTNLGVLTISGTGSMYDWDYIESVPWYGYTGMINSLVLPDGLTRIGSCAFYGCRNLTQAELPDTVTSIGGSAFNSCGLTRISMPVSLVSIDRDAFYEDTGLTDVYYGGTMEAWRQINLYDGNRPLLAATIHCTDGDIDNSARCGDDLTWSFDEETGTLTVTGEGEMWGAPMAWDGIKDQIRAVVIEEGATCVGDSAFRDCGALTSVTLPTSLRWVGYSSFCNCDALTGIVIPEGVRELDSDAFNNCDVLADVTLPESLAYIYYSAFGYCNSLATITIPLGVTYIENYAFGYCNSLSEIRFEGAAPSIMDSAFYEVSATAYYPSNIPGWTEDVLQNYGGTLNWVPYEVEDSVVAEGVCGDDLTWTLTRLGVLTISGSGEMYAWNSTDDVPWFDYHTIISSVELPEELSSISDMAFYECRNLTEITIPANVTRIGSYAFCSCGNLTSVILPESLQTLEQGVFASCSSLPAIELPDGLLEIGYDAFEWCSSLREITIPASVEWIGDFAFNNCGSMTAFYVDPDNLQYASVDGILYRRSGESSLYSLVVCPAMKTGTVTVPDSVREILNSAFQHCTGVTAVALPADLTWIGAWAFYNCDGLTDIEIPENVTWLSDSVFCDCDNLVSVTLPNGMYHIGYCSFESCDSLCSITFPYSLSEIENYAFSSCGSLSEITFQSTAPYIEDYAFYEVSATAWYPTNMDGWTEDVLQNYGGTLNWMPYELEETVIASGACGDDLTWTLTSMWVLTISGTGDMYDFDYDGLPWGDWCGVISTVELPDGLTRIGSCAFYGCNGLTSVTIPEGVTSIGDGAFGWCGSLTSVEIPASVTGIGNMAFSGCSGMTAIEVAEENENYSSLDGILYNKEQTALIQCPGGKTDALELPEGLTEIKSSAFYFCSSLVSVEIPESVTSIGDGAFAYCSSLTSVELPAGVTEIGNNAFIGCTGLTSVTLPEGLTSIADWAFYSCAGLTSVTLPEGLTSIGYSAFYRCISLESVEFPAGLTTIGDWAFVSCSSLKNVVFLGGPPEIGEYSFGDVTIDAWYPADDETWTEEVRQDYGGDLTWIPCRDGKPVNSFADVPEGKYYYAPVLWAYYHDPQITGGTSDTTFGPNKTCTREQIVTFLWKACGAPEPESTTNPFTDVKESKYYYKAVLWAVENNITGGVSADKFGVGRPCTREQAMTFLWKACGSPAPENSSNPFSDVPETKYYYNAVLWAVEKGITGGVSATAFGVGRPCTRGQIVTFLYAARSFLHA